MAFDPLTFDPAETVDGAIFRPNRPRFANETLIVCEGNRITWLREGPSDILVSNEKLLALLAAKPNPGAVHGVLVNNLGGVAVWAEGERVEWDARFEHQIPFVEAKYVWGTSAAPAARWAADVAATLTLAHAEGWELVPERSSHGFLLLEHRRFTL